MRTETIEYLGEQFEVRGFYSPASENSCSGEQFAPSFEVEEVVWIIPGETNSAILVNVEPTMSDEVIQEIQEIVLTKIASYE